MENENLAAAISPQNIFIINLLSDLLCVYIVLHSIHRIYHETLCNRTKTHHRYW